MCGIIGKIGKEDVSKTIINGLEKLEYRGYDSSGIAIFSDDEIKIIKDAIRVEELAIASSALSGSSGIGHTRWATHGKPNQINAHPHMSFDNRFCIVHNGVIENVDEIKAKYLSGVTYKGETDTEKIAHLLAVLSEKSNDILKVLSELHNIMEGSYAILILDKNNPSYMYALKNKSPLLIGIGDKFNLVSSDAIAIVNETTELKEINDGEFVKISSDEVKIYDGKLKEISRESFESVINHDEIALGVHDHYMLKEINEQPGVIRELVKKYLPKQYLIEEDILKVIKEANQIHIVGAGTSMHASLLGKNYFESIACKPTYVHIASEFAYTPPLCDENDVFIFVSQSGETADLRASLQVIRNKNPLSKVITITNVQQSTLDREADLTLYLYAGVEIAVASTKAYMAQATLFYILANALAQTNCNEVKLELAKLANAIEDICFNNKRIKKNIPPKLFKANNAFIMGRGIDYYGVLEAALKIKEITYMHIEGVAAGELKHGTIALIEQGMPIIVFDTTENTRKILHSNVEEVKSRGAEVFVISSNTQINSEIHITDVNKYLNVLLAIVYSQLFSYYIALEKNLDIDKPRNLAKSVTVE